MTDQVWCPPSWPPDEWAVVTMLFEEAFKTPPGQEWTNRKAKAYGTMLDAYQPAAVVAAVKRLAAAGQTFLPSVGDIIGAIRADLSAPSWTEAFEMIFGPRGALSVRLPRGSRPADEAERDRVLNQAIIERAAAQHEMVGAFVATQGPRRLRMLPIHDPDWGEKTRRDLGVEWDEFVDKADARRREGLPLLTPALAARRELGPARMDANRLLEAAGFPGTDAASTEQESRR